MKGRTGQNVAVLVVFMWLLLLPGVQVQNFGWNTSPGLWCLLISNTQTRQEDAGACNPKLVIHNGVNEEWRGIGVGRSEQICIILVFCMQKKKDQNILGLYQSFTSVFAAAELHSAFTYDSHHFRLYFTLSHPIYKLRFLIGRQTVTEEGRP